MGSVLVFLKGELTQRETNAVINRKQTANAIESQCCVLYLILVMMSINAGGSDDGSSSRPFIQSAEF